MPEPCELSPEALSRLDSSQRSPGVQESMKELLRGACAAYSGLSLALGDEGWRVVELRRSARVIVRVFPKDGLVKIENLDPNGKDGDYGDLISLRQKSGEWACRIPNGGVPDELLLCIDDAVRGVADGRRRVHRTGSSVGRSAQAAEWRRSKLPASVRFHVLLRDQYTCQYCGQSAPDVVLHIDHRTPLARGGGDEVDNLVTACATCNLGKSARHST